MKNIAKLLFGIIVVFIFFSVKVAFAQEFSADVVTTTKEGTYSGKIFVTKDKVRTELTEAITITRMDKKVAWMLMPAEKTYMEQPFDPNEIVTASEKFPGEIERTLIGQELVDGKTADKYRIVYETEGVRETVFQWIEASSNIPVKTEAEDGSWTVEYKNLKIGAQPESLFEIPADYTKISYPLPPTEDILKGMEEEYE